MAVCANTWNVINGASHLYSEWKHQVKTLCQGYTEIIIREKVHRWNEMENVDCSALHVNM